jgi:hypothetical protein
MSFRGDAVASVVADAQTMRGVASLSQSLRCWFGGRTAPRGAGWQHAPKVTASRLQCHFIEEASVRNSFSTR